MILQHFIFQKEEICKEKNLYYKEKDGNGRMSSLGFTMEEGKEYSFFTYFNAFSLELWGKYTIAKNYYTELEIYGAGTVTLWNAFLDDGKVVRQKGPEMTFHTNTDFSEGNGNVGSKKKLMLAIPTAWKKGMVYIVVQTETKSIFHKGEFCCEEQEVRQVNLAVGICTFRREAFVQKTITNVKMHFLEDSQSILYGHVHVYISDNGNTLDLFTMNSEGVTCVYNKNAGGTGGFTRCLLEALQDQPKNEYTHFLFMDDDIVVEPEVFYRSYCMLMYLKEEYENAAIGGGLLRMDLPDIQHTSGDLWDVDRVKSPFSNLDMTKEKNLLTNELPVPKTFNGWWYCIMPFDEMVKDDLPLPIFIHVDDVEYGLRFTGEMIHMNGIGVWHESFDHRKASSMEYYDMRNLLIVNAIHNPDYNWKMARKRIWRHLVLQTLKYRYDDMELTMRGVEDFCHGLEFLKRKDPMELHQEIMRVGYRFQDQSNQLDRLDKKWRERKTTKESLKVKKTSKWKLLLFNGLFLPGKKKVCCVPMGADVTELFRAKNVLYFDPYSGKGFFVARKRTKIWQLLKLRWHLTDVLQRDYDRAVRSYREHYSEIVTDSFWRKYLGLNETEREN